MKNYFKFLFFSLVLASFTNLLADYNVEMQNNNHQVIEQPLLGGYNTSANIRVSNSYNTFIEASFIYWQALAYDIYLGLYGNFNVNNLPADGIAQIPLFAAMDFDYHPGFKVAMGLQAYDEWKLQLQYTYFKMSETSSAINNNDPNLVTLLLAWEPTRMNRINDISYAKWNLFMNVVDLALCHSYYVSPKLILSPFIGAKAFWNYQRYHTIAVVTGNDSFLEHYIFKNDSWALGARAGIDTKWKMGAGWNIFGNLAMSLNYQHFRMIRYNYRDEWVLQPENNLLPLCNHKDSLAGVVPVAEMALGFNWGTYFSNCNWYFDFAMAYEFQVWWDQNVLMAYMKSDFRNDLGNNNQVPSFVPFDPKKLMLHGLTVSLKLDF